MLEAVSAPRQDHIRDRAMLLTLFNTGARVQELLDIRPGDLQLDRPTSVHLRGKGRKERLCPLWPETADALRTLLSVPSKVNTGPVFRNHRGEPMTRFGVRYLLRRFAEQARTAAPTLHAKRVHPHTCRHYLPFRTMSCGGTGMRFGPMILGPIMQRPRQFARHSLLRAADCSGRTEGGRGHSDWPFQARRDPRTSQERPWELRARAASLPLIKSRRSALSPNTELRSPLSMSPLHLARRLKIRATERLQDIVRKGR